MADNSKFSMALRVTNGAVMVTIAVLFGLYAGSGEHPARIFHLAYMRRDTGALIDEMRVNAVSGGIMLSDIMDNGPWHTAGFENKKYDYDCEKGTRIDGLPDFAKDGNAYSDAVACAAITTADQAGKDKCRSTPGCHYSVGQNSCMIAQTCVDRGNYYTNTVSLPIEYRCDVANIDSPGGVPCKRDGNACTEVDASYFHDTEHEASESSSDSTSKEYCESELDFFHAAIGVLSSWLAVAVLAAVPMPIYTSRPWVGLLANVLAVALHVSFIVIGGLYFFNEYKFNINESSIIKMARVGHDDSSEYVLDITEESGQGWDFLMSILALSIISGFLMCTRVGKFVGWVTGNGNEYGESSLFAKFSVL